MEKYRNKYRIESARLKGYDYGWQGLYFITICTKDRINYFGEIHNVETDNYPSLQKTIIGHIAFDYWEQIPQHFPFVELDEFVIMPNHVHGILFFNRPHNQEWTPNKFGPQSQNLASVIRGYKSSVKYYANKNNIDFEWQSRYHDRIIRDAQELNAVREYINTNPLNWENDEFNNSKTLKSIIK